MTVWVAINSVAIDDWQVVGVYDSEEKAYDSLSGHYGANYVQKYEVE